jgi:hypothetical protein
VWHNCIKNKVASHFLPNFYAWLHNLVHTLQSRFKGYIYLSVFPSAIKKLIAKTFGVDAQMKSEGLAPHRGPAEQSRGVVVKMRN